MILTDPHPTHTHPGYLGVKNITGIVLRAILIARVFCAICATVPGCHHGTWYAFRRSGQKIIVRVPCATIYKLTSLYISVDGHARSMWLHTHTSAVASCRLTHTSNSASDFVHRT